MNVHAVPHLADRPETDADALSDLWIREHLKIDNPEVATAIKTVLQHSTEMIRQGFYVGPFATDRTSAWHPNGDLIQDDLIDAQAAWRMIQQLPDSKLDQVVAEKQAAVELLDTDHTMLQKLMKKENQSVLDPMMSTLIYTSAMFQTIHNLFEGLIA